MRYFVTGPDSRESGPFEIATLKEWIAIAQLPPGAMVRAEGTNQKVQAQRVPELREAYRGPPYNVRPAKLIPVGNQPALASYYIGLCSFLCFIGLLATPVAIWLGVKGLKLVEEDPEAHGRWHAVAGIALGTLGVFAHAAFIYWIANSP